MWEEIVRLMAGRMKEEIVSVGKEYLCEETVSLEEECL
jgi:hypothetical protein